MKSQNIRRVGVLVLMMFLALTLMLVLTAPGQEASAAAGATENPSPEPTAPPEPNFYIIDSRDLPYDSDDVLTLTVGQSMTLRLQWATAPEEVIGSIGYRWSCKTGESDFNGAAFSGNGSTIDEAINVMALTATGTDDVTITVKATWSDGTSTKNATAECKLKITDVTPTVTIDGAPEKGMKVGDEVELTASCDFRSSFGSITYEWKCGTDGVFEITPDATGAKATVKALKATESERPVEITVTANWTYNGKVYKTVAQTRGITVGPKLVITSDGNENKLMIGETATLTAKWDYGTGGLIDNPYVEGSEYLWECDPNGAAVSFNTGDGSSTKITARTKGTAIITVTVIRTGDKAAYELEIVPPELKITSDKVKDGKLELKVGEKARLTAELVDGAPESGVITYEWKYDPVLFGPNRFEPGLEPTNEIEVTARQATSGTATITVTAYWDGYGPGHELATQTLAVSITESKLAIKHDYENGKLQVWQNIRLTPELDEVVNGVDEITYTWGYDHECFYVSSDDDHDGSFSGEYFDAQVRGGVTGKTTVTVTASANGIPIGSAECTLEIVKPKLEIFDTNRDNKAVKSPLTMQIGETDLGLQVDWAVGTGPWQAGPDQELYDWSCDIEDVVGFEASSSAWKAITPVRAGETTVTVKVTCNPLDSGLDPVTAEYELKITVKEPKLEISGATGGEPLKKGEEIRLTAKWTDGQPWPGAPKEIKYKWECSNGTAVQLEEIEDSKGGIPSAKIKVLEALQEAVTVTLTATWRVPGTEKDTDEVTVTRVLNLTVPVTGVKLDKDKLKLKMYDSETLTPIFDPTNAANKNVTWKSSDETVAIVDKNGKVTGVGVGKATITVTTEDGGKTAQCEVEVVIPSVTGLTFGTSGSIVRSNSDSKTWPLTVSLLQSGAELGDGKIEWSVTLKEGNPETTVLPTISGTNLTVTNDGHKATGTNLTAQITSGSPGVFTVTATYVTAEGKVGAQASIEVTVSGITLTRTKVNLFVGQSATIAIDQIFGYADNSVSTADVDWNSSDPSTVSVMYGELTGWKLGKDIIITVTKNGYTAQCVVNVTEDSDVVIGPYPDITTGKPLRLSDIYTDLNQISINKTQEKDDNNNVIKKGSNLAYITNVTVPTNQGTLYYNYNSEANTGDGVGATDRFARTASGAIRSLSMLYFVPRQGFKGTAEITFNGWSESGVSFSGVIKVTVDGTERNINYRTRSDAPVYFLTDDFDAYSRGITGRGVSYITFSLPQVSQGVLYYNYVAGEGIRVSASTRFSQSGRYTIGDVCFVPNAYYVGDVTIVFYGMDTAGQTFTGSIVVSVASSGEDSSGVYFSGERGGPVTLQSSLFNAACQEAIHDTLSFVTFKLPALEEGMLYYNYRGVGDFDSRVNATTRYRFSGVPSINNITFVPASNATGRIAISYTGYGTTGATFTGTLYINMDEVDRTTIYYFVSKNNYVALDTRDFNNAGLNRLGAGVDYVRFGTASTSLGTLRYNYQSSASSLVSTYTSYYLNPNTWQRGLSLIAFRAGDATGTVTIPYTAYCGTRSFTGKVVIQVGSLTPADTEVSCKTSGQAWLSSSALSRACSPAMSEELSYIEITSVPDPEMGRLYLNYVGFGTGTVVNQGDRFYCAGSPSINRLSFVPRAGFTGEAEITYIGYSSDSQEQVSGRVIVNVTRSEISSFSDMDSYAWAIDSVEFLRWNGTVNGVGDGSRFAPGNTVKRADFVLMLIRAFGFTASGGSSFTDVPADSYYADAIRIASALGIVRGYDGRFDPMSPLSRQDAMVMIFNALKASGKTITNGLAADLSVFHDREEVASYALEAMGSLVQMGVVKGNGKGYLLPRDTLNRAETAMLLHTIMTL